MTGDGPHWLVEFHHVLLDLHHCKHCISFWFMSTCTHMHIYLGQRHDLMIRFVRNGCTRIYMCLYVYMCVYVCVCVCVCVCCLCVRYVCVYNGNLQCTIFGVWLTPSAVWPSCI